MGTRTASAMNGPGSSAPLGLCRPVKLPDEENRQASAYGSSAQAKAGEPFMAPIGSRGDVRRPPASPIGPADEPRHAHRPLALPQEGRLLSLLADRLSADEASHLAAILRERETRGIDVQRLPSEDVGELLDMLGQGERPSLGWWRRHLPPPVRRDTFLEEDIAHRRR